MRKNILGLLLIIILMVSGVFSCIGEDRETSVFPVTSYLLKAAKADKRIKELEDKQKHSFLRITPEMGRRFHAKLEPDRPAEVKPLHLYRLDLRVRRMAGMRFSVGPVFGNDNNKPIECPQNSIPPVDYLVAPVWEWVKVFLVIPPESRFLHFNLWVYNRKDGLKDGYVDIGELRLTDGGALKKLKNPRQVTRIDEWLLENKLVRQPRAPSSGSGVYRLRAKADVPKATKVCMILMQGDDPRLHWHRTTELGANTSLEAGTKTVEWLFYVGDRRFIHQWVRGLTRGKGSTVKFTDMVLEQLMEEPINANKLGQQTPKHR